MKSSKLVALASVSLIATMLAVPAAAQSVPAGDPGTTTQPGQRTNTNTSTDTPTPAANAATPDQAGSGDDIVVTGVAAAARKGLAVKRQSVQVVESVIAEDVGKLPDNNVVSALQRISGVQVTDRSGGEANTVSIRGLPDVLTTLNGRTIFTADSRQFALADIPATLVSRIDVYKTRAADQVETGLAGQIDVFTHRPFDFDGFTFSAYTRGIYNEQSDKVNPYLSALISNRWETPIGDVGVMVNGSYSRNRYSDQSTSAGALVPFVTADNPPAGYLPLQRIFPPVFQAGLQQGLPSAAGSTIPINGVETPYLLSRDAVFQNNLRGDRKRPAVNAALQWAPNSSSTYTAEFFYDGYRNTTFNDLLFSFVDFWGDLGPNPGSTFTTYDGTNIIHSRTAGSVFGFQSGDFTRSKTDSFVYALNGKWDVGDRLKLSADLSMQNSTNRNSFIAMRLNRVAKSINVNFNSGNGLPAFHFDDDNALKDVGTWKVGELYDNAAKTKGDAVTFQGDGDYEPDSDFFKKLSFGVRYDRRTAEDYTRSQSAGALNQPFSSLDSNYVYTEKDFFQGRADVPTSWVVPNGYYIASHADDVRALYQTAFPTIQLSDDLSLVNTLHVREITKSAYIQGDFEAPIFGRPLRVEGGVRYTDVRTPLTFTDQYTRASSSAKQHTHAFLPSVTVRYELTDSLQLRFNFGKTLRRPDFASLNPNFTLTDDLTQVGYGSGTGGNPNLKATRATNYDLTAEWYFAKGSGIYGTLFRREINGLVVSLANYQTVANSPYPDTNSFVITQPVNASNGVLKGAELGAVLFPPNLPGILKGFGAQGSLTILKSSQNIPISDAAGQIVGQQQTSFFGVSNFSYNITGAYDRGPIGLRLSYVWRKPFLNANEASLFANPIGIWRRAEKSLDFQATLQATKRLAITFDAVNLTREFSQQYYYFAGAGGPDTDNQVNTMLARTFALGVRYSLK